MSDGGPLGNWTSRGGRTLPTRFLKVGAVVSRWPPCPPAPTETRGPPGPVDGGQDAAIPFTPPNPRGHSIFPTGETLGVLTAQRSGCGTRSPLGTTMRRTTPPGRVSPVAAGASYLVGHLPPPPGRPHGPAHDAHRPSREVAPAGGRQPAHPHLPRDSPAPLRAARGDRRGRPRGARPAARVQPAGADPARPDDAGDGRL